MKKLIPIIATVLTLLLSTMLVVACNGHTHTYEEGWTASETTHYHKATCEHTDKRKDEEPHSFGSDNKCTVCGHVKGGSLNEADGHDFKVTVLGPDGQPYVDATIQICRPGGQCFEGFPPVDKNGVCYIDLGGAIPADVTRVEIHVKNIPDYYTHDECIIDKGKSAVINLKENFSELEGTGAGVFEGDIIKNEGFDPYKMSLEKASTKIKVNENAKTIYIEFTGDFFEGEAFPAKISVSVRGASATITALDGLNEKGIVKTDNKASGEDPSLNFNMTQAICDAGNKTYIEIAFDDSAVGKDVIIVFNFEGDLD